MSIHKIIVKIHEVSRIVSSAIFKMRHTLTSLIQQLNLALQDSLPMDLLKPSKMIVFTVPVVQKGLSLNVFHAIVVPVPQENSSISANYKLETTFLPVSSDTYLRAKS